MEPVTSLAPWDDDKELGNPAETYWRAQGRRGIFKKLASPTCVVNRIKKELQAIKSRLQLGWQLGCPLSAFRRKVRRLYELHSKDGSAKPYGVVLAEVARLVRHSHSTVELCADEYFRYRNYLDGVDPDTYAYCADYWNHWKVVLEKWVIATDAGWLTGMDADNTATEDKELMLRKFQGFGLPATTRLGCTVQRESGIVVESDGVHPPILFLELLQREKRLFFKPVDGNQGRGCFMAEYGDGGIKIDRKAAKDSDLQGMLAPGLRVEKVLEQHPVFAALHPSSINTMRIVTLLRSDGTPYILAQCLRVGKGGSSTDNWSTTGIVVGVNDDGTLKKHAYSKEAEEPAFVRHPDTGIVFEGYRIPYLAEAKELVLRAHRCFPGLLGVGWDVAVTPDGPILLEGNINFGINTIQQTCGGLRKELAVMRKVVISMAHRDERMKELLIG